MNSGVGIIGVACIWLGTLSTACAGGSSDTSYEAARGDPRETGVQASLGNDVIGWRAALLKTGVLSETGPYRIALPVAAYGEDGPRLLFTYIPRMKDGVANRVLMFMIKADLD